MKKWLLYFGIIAVFFGLGFFLSKYHINFPIKILSYESSLGNSVDMIYLYKNGSRNFIITISSPKDLMMDLNVKVRFGKVELSLIAPNGETIYREVYERDVSKKFTVTLPSPGTYILKLNFIRTSGKIKLSWFFVENA